MTQTIERRPLPRPLPPAGRPGVGVLVPGSLAAAWAIGAGLVALAVPVLLAWATDSRSGSGAGDATRAAGQLWLLAHGASLDVPGGVVGLTPLGLVLLPLALLRRAGRHAARSTEVADVRAAASLVVAVAFPYAVAAGFLAAVSASDSISPDPVSAMLGGFLVAVVGAGAGVLRQSGLLRLTSRFPARVRRLATAALGAVCVLLGGGALLAGGALAGHAGRATSLAGASDPGLVGGLTLCLLGLVLAPNAAVWGAAFATGPGFAVGVGTAVSPLGTTLGSVPALPLLAALPGGDVPTWVVVPAVLTPLLAGVVAGLLTVRRLPVGGRLTAAREAALVGPCAGVALAVLGYLSGGPLGGAHLSDVGPSPWRLGLATALEVGVTAALTAATCARRRGSLGSRP